MTLPYQTSRQCQQQLKDIEAIDYFFAKQICEELSVENEQLFHLFLALSYFLRQGHSCLPIKVIANQWLWNNESEGQDEKNALQQGFQFIGLDEFSRQLEKLSLAEADNKALIFDGEQLFIRRYWQFEQEVADKINQLNRFYLLSKEQLLTATEVIAKLFPQASETKVSHQQIAVANALGSQFSIISGGPGTGKTYTVTRVLIALQSVFKGQLKIAMAAPTGKAAQRLKESISGAKQALSGVIEDEILSSIPDKAATLHRLLGFRPLSLHLKHDASSPLDCDVLLIDEASMIDLAMMTKVLRALKDDTRLILLGDVNQLPSVDTGNILADICGGKHQGYQQQYSHQIYQLCGAKVAENEQSHLSYLTYLEKSHRSSGDILNLASMVISKQVQASINLLEQNRSSEQHITHLINGQIQFSDERENDFDLWLNSISRFYYQSIQKSESLLQAYQLLSQFRILVPTRVGQRGVVQLNHKVREILGHAQHEVYKGCPIMITQNSYQTGLFNGDIGIIWPDKSGKNHVWFEQGENGELHPFHLSRLPAFETVYAMTIHKTQGSEFAQVAMVLPEKDSRTLDAKLLYTGMTRAKQGLTIYGSKAVWESALSNDNPRYSGLNKRF